MAGRFLIRPGQMVILFVAFFLLCMAAGMLSAAPIRTTHGCDPTTYAPAPDVAYQDGVDASGWAVAPADLSPPPLSASDFETTHIQLNVPLRKYVEDERYNLDASESNLMLGTIDITQGGGASFNGRPLAAEEPVTECGEHQP